MTIHLFERIALKYDIPEKRLRRGDVATIVDHHPGHPGEDGYSLEVFNALGETIAVVTVPESAVQPLSANEIFSIRELVVA